MVLIYQPSKRIFCGWFEPLKSTTYSEYPKKEPRLHVLWFGEGSQFSAALYVDMLEEVREYDPHKWNEYPEVTPPEGVWMRCETDLNAIEHKIRHVAKFDGREWRDYLSKQVVGHRFRPWDNPEDEE